MLALAFYEAQVCECGLHPSVAQDPETAYTIDTDSCPVCADIAAFTRIQGAEDEKAEKALGEKAPPQTPRPADGRLQRLRLLGADEAAAMQPLRS